MFLQLLTLVQKIVVKRPSNPVYVSFPIPHKLGKKYCKAFMNDLFLLWPPCFCNFLIGTHIWKQSRQKDWKKLKSKGQL